MLWQLFFCALSVNLCVHPVEYLKYWSGPCCRVLQSALCCSVLRLLSRKAKYSYVKHHKILTFFMNLTLPPGTVLVPHFLKEAHFWKEYLLHNINCNQGYPIKIFKEQLASPVVLALQSLHRQCMSLLIIALRKC